MTRVRRTSRSSSGSMRSSTDLSNRSRHLQPRPPSAQNAYKSASLSPHDSRSRPSHRSTNSESPQLATHQDHLASHRSPAAERLTPQTPESFHSLGSSTDSSYVMSNFGSEMTNRPEMRNYPTSSTINAGVPATALSQSTDSSYVPNSDTMLSQHNTAFDSWSRSSEGLFNRLVFYG